MSTLDDLKAMIEERDKIKGIVLYLLHWQKGIPFNDAKNILTSEVENRITPPPEDVKRN